MRIMSKTITSDQLRISDFYAHPIWGFKDDDGDEVMPVDYPGHLIWSNGGESLFVLCRYVLNNDEAIDGVIGVRMTNQSLYLLKFPAPDGSLFYFPVNSPLEGTVTPAQLAAQLNRKLEEIFPIRFHTQFIFEDGKRLVGQYDLPGE